MTTAEQRTAALKLANHVRISQARTLGLIRSTTDREQSWHLAAAMVECPTNETASLRVSRLLGACRGMGPGKVKVILTTTQTSEFARVGTLTGRQRTAIASALNAGTMRGFSRQAA